MSTILLILLAGAGLYISVYFALLFFAKVRPESPIVPRFCRPDAAQCFLVLGHPDARLLGVPNAVPGAFYFCWVVVFAIGRGEFIPEWTGVALSWAVVSAGVYLTYSLFFKVRIRCPLCMVSHGITLMIALVISFWP